MQPAVENIATNLTEAEADSARAWAGIPCPLLLDLSCLELTDDQLERISIDNSSLQLELTAKGELIVMPPEAYPGWDKEMELARQFANWAKEDGTGIVSGPSGGFRLPNEALYAPVASWTLRTRRDEWQSQQDNSSPGRLGGFPPLCPDFVLELRSSGERLTSLQRKMQEYLENGARLGWIIDPINEQAYIYRPGEAVEVLDEPETLPGDPVLPGFVLQLQEIW